MKKTVFDVKSIYPFKEARMRGYGVITAAFMLILFSASVSKGGDTMAFKISSPDFKEGDTIPKRFTCEGEDVSPEMHWEGAPSGTKSFSLIVEDPDAPVGTFTHWVLYDIPGNLGRLEQGAGRGEGMKNGITDFGRASYGGPCPPKGHGTHRYFFILRALDVETLGAPQGARKPEVEKRMKGHILGETRLMGVYRR